MEATTAYIGTLGEVDLCSSEALSAAILAALAHKGVVPPTRTSALNAWVFRLNTFVDEMCHNRSLAVSLVVRSNERLARRTEAAASAAAKAAARRAALDDAAADAKAARGEAAAAAAQLRWSKAAAADALRASRVAAAPVSAKERRRRAREHDVREALPPMPPPPNAEALVKVILRAPFLGRTCHGGKRLYLYDVFSVGLDLLDHSFKGFSCLLSCCVVDYNSIRLSGGDFNKDDPLRCCDGDKEFLLL